LFCGVLGECVDKLCDIHLRLEKLFNGF
jgi:hypothetical protein